MLEIKNVTKIFNKGTVNEKVALDDFSLTLEDGDFVTVIGGNGSGKSTMMNAIAGVWPVDEGRIVIDGIDVTKLPEHKRAKYLGRVFQDPMTGTAATMGIEENLALAKRRGKSRSLKTGITKKEREEYKELLKSLDLSLEERMTSKVGLLSGGQRQALTLLMATLQKPKVLLLDEHTAALDSSQGTGNDRKDREQRQADYSDDHSQHEGCHCAWQPTDHAEGWTCHSGYQRRRKEEAYRRRPAS